MRWKLRFFHISESSRFSELLHHGRHSVAMILVVMIVFMLATVPLFMIVFNGDGEHKDLPLAMF